MKPTARVLVTAFLSVLALVIAVPAAGAATPLPRAAMPVIDAAAAPPADQQTMGGGLSTLDSPATDPARTVGPLAVPNSAAATTAINTKGGNMFDTCKAPAVSDMTAWLASPYRTVGIYVGGIARGCPTQVNLTPSWVTSVTSMGWNLVPIYVGLQAPCNAAKYPSKVMSLTASTAAGQGAAAAKDAIVQMRSLGIGQNVPIYFDMEYYSPSDGPCSAAVKAFTNAWTANLHSQGWLSGLYGSSESMIRQAQLWTAAGGYASPDNVWFARWNGVPTADDTALPADAWAGHRIHQFTGGHQETWGGVTINIDSSFVQTFATPPSYASALNPRVVWDSRTAIVGTNPVALGVGGVGGAPRDATAAILNCEVIDPTANGSLVVMPWKSNVNTSMQQFSKGQYISATVVVPLSAMNIQFRLTAGKARVVVSAEGYLSTATGYQMTAMAPRLVYDSRTAKITTNPTALEVGGNAGVPRNATAAMLSIQVVHPTAAGSLIVKPWKSGSVIGMQQFGKDQAISTTVLVPLSARNMEFRLTAGKARVIVTAVGYLAPITTVPGTDSGAGTTDTGGVPTTADIPGQVVATSPSLAWDSRVNAVGAGWIVPGLLGVPGNAAAVLVNVQVVNPSAAGNLIVAPKGSGSTIGVQQFRKGQTVSTLMLVPLIDRAIQLRVTAGNARVIVTNVGYVTS